MPAFTTVNAPITTPVGTARRKRVLLLTHRFPYPPNRGDRIRSYNLMRVLAESFDVTLACPHDEPVSDAELQHVNQICSAVITAPVGTTRWLRAGVSLLGGHSLTEGLFHQPAIADQVLACHQAQPFDAALVFCSSMFPYVDHDAFRDTPMIVDLVDVDSEKWRQLSIDRSGPKSWIYSIESKRVRTLERRIADRADAITLVSDQEADLFKSTITTTTPVHGVSNGVNTDYFRPPSQREASASGPPSQREASASGASNLLFTGVLDYPPNVEGLIWFCTKILPTLRNHVDIQLTIVGRRPNQAVKDLGSLDGVNLVGEVPDVRPYLHAADIAISPLKLARGIQNKVLEAMACGLPVITTTQSAEGIDAIDGSEFIIADDEAAWVDAISDLANDTTVRTRMACAARVLVVDHYAWSARMSQITNLLSVAIAEHRLDVAN
ncbi:TIGR03087 family PEP-CTERM/XrtA system glycosyltransferase [Stieleria magnilauensis]|uniref:GDP-mannose-dependent alpha-(1-6)-phosphatidylinositol monomannoside mannosyltransferase n=1 Tax=Stieleria magnilauensis TaxID=2527963 RepID=A0ABX5XMK9_9BACT|nr:GDP-mannose-dependent alpha-(1-6)-phosphatidylinositol monomannoside mannosyltransferase [Planctomycetes bacterium TBK1r]